MSRLTSSSSRRAAQAVRAADPRRRGDRAPPRRWPPPSACARRSSRAGTARWSSAPATSASRWPRRSPTAVCRVTMIEAGAAGDGDARRRHGRPTCRTPPRRTACGSSSARRSRRSCSTTPARRSACAPPTSRSTPTTSSSASGAKPLVDLAEAAGLEVGDSGALRVDDHQRCPGHDGVFAVGDCAESHHRVLDRPVNIQLGTHANKQGRIAGANAHRRRRRASPACIGTAVSKICRYEVGRTGHLRARGGRRRDRGRQPRRSRTARAPATTRAPGPIWVKLVAEPGSGRLLGGQIVGVEGAAKRIDVLATRGLDRAWRSTSSRCSTSPTRRRSAASTTRC